jgi:hypothetical protein
MGQMLLQLVMWRSEMDLGRFDEPKARTGRTTRLIAEAKRLSAERRAVYVISRDAKAIEEQIEQECPGCGIKVEEHVPHAFDWVTMRVRGSHPNCVWLIDHWIIASDPKFASMFEMMTRFDV